VVVAEDDRGCGAANEGAKHVAWMHLDPGQGSARDTGFLQDAMANVKSQHPEFLYWRGTQACPVVCPDIGRVAQELAAFWPRSGHSAAELDGCLNGRCSGGSNPWQRA